MIIRPIAQQLHGIYNEDYNIYNVDCNSTIGPVTFTIGGIEYPIEQQQLIIDLETGDCALTLFPYGDDSEPTWIFGYSWFHRIALYSILAKKILVLLNQYFKFN